MRFGNATLIREQSREFRLSGWLDATIQDVRYAWRGMLKNKGFAATAILSLGLAIGANTAIYSIIDAALLRPLPLPEAGRLFTLGEGDVFSFPVYTQFRTIAPLAAFASVDNVEAQQGIETTAPYEKVNQQLVSGDSFDILKVHPAAGRLFTAAEDRGNDGHLVTVLGYDYWQRRFGGDPSIVGRTIRIAGRPSPFRVIGVTQQGFFGVEPGKFVDLWLPLKTFDPDAFTNPDFRWLHLMGRGNAATTLARLEPAFHQSQEELIKRDMTLPSDVQKQLREMKLRVYPGSVGAYGFQRTFRASPLDPLRRSDLHPADRIGQCGKPAAGAVRGTLRRNGPPGFIGRGPQPTHPTTHHGKLTALRSRRPVRLGIRK